MKERLGGRGAAGVVVLASACLLLAACGDAPESADSPTASKVLRRGNGGAPGSLDPALAVDIHAFNVLADLYEGLVATGPDGSLIPGVAESWEVSDDGRSYTFRLRKDARWSDGSPVVAPDFVRSLQRVAAPQTAAVYGDLLAPLLNFEEVRGGNLPVTALGVTAASDTELTMTLSSPASHWLSIMALPIAYPTKSGSDGQALTNGPYILEERQAAGFVRLSRNPQYWSKDTIAIDQVEFYPITDPVAEFNGYRAGELHMTHVVPSERITALRNDRPGELRIAPSLALYYLALDLSEAPFDNLALRQALSMAVDRETLVDLVGRGEQAAFGIVPTGVDGHTNAVYDWQALSPTERKRIAGKYYAQAGYGPGNPLRLRLIYDAGDIHERVALAISAMWSDALGVETRLQKMEWKMFLDTRDRKSEWDVMRFAWFGDYNAPMTFLEIFHSESRQNLPGYTSAAYDELLDGAAATTDEALRRQSLHDAERVLLDDYPIVPLYFFVSKHLVSPGVSGFEDNILDRHPTRFLDIVGR